MANLRVLQVLAGAPAGGAETAYVDFCIALKEADVEVIAATRANDLRVSRLEQAGIPVHTYPFGGLLDIYTPYALKKLIQLESPDIIQTWMSRAADKLPKWKGEESEKPYRVLSRLGGYYKLKYYTRTDYFSTITPDIKRYLEDQGIAKERIRHINNFAETETIETPVSKADLNTPDNAPVLLSLGRLHEAKALDVLIKAMTDIPSAYLWLAGEGPQRAELEQLAETQGVAGRVRFLGWRSDRAALLAAADICVFPSRYEPFGTTSVQAWANKIPLVCSDADGPRQFVKDGEDGLMVPKDDEQALAAAINRLLGAYDLSAKLVDNGYRRYLNEFTKEQTIQDYIRYYQDILRTNDTSTADRIKAPA